MMLAHGLAILGGLARMAVASRRAQASERPLAPGPRLDTAFSRAVIGSAMGARA